MARRACSLIRRTSGKPTVKAEWGWTHPAEMAAMGSAARKRYQQKYTAEQNYERLMNIYEAVLTN